MTRLTQCLAADYWPGVAPEPVPWIVPAYLEGIIDTGDTEESEDF